MAANAETNNEDEQNDHVRRQVGSGKAKDGPHHHHAFVELEILEHLHKAKQDGKPRQRADVLSKRRERNTMSGRCRVEGGGGSNVVNLEGVHKAEDIDIIALLQHVQMDAFHPPPPFQRSVGAEKENEVEVFGTEVC